MIVNIEEIDRQLEFLRKEEARLRALKAYWADNNAIMLKSIHETLRRLRQEQQMAGINGQKIE